MLNYNDLSSAQQKYIDLVSLYFPGLEVVTFSKLNEIHAFFLKKRGEDARFKVGFPIWLVSNNRRGRDYLLPLQHVVLEDEVSELDREFQIEYGEFL